MNDNDTRPDAQPTGANSADAHPADAEPVAAEPTPEERIAELEDRYRRALAEMDNLRKLKDRDVEEARKLGITRFARDLLDVGDNLSRALQAVPGESAHGNEALKTLLTGVEMTQRTLHAVFERHQIQTVRPQPGEKFDPTRHQAMFEVPTAASPPGTIAEVVQAGYVIADRLLRPAMVGVAKAPAGPGEGNANHG